MTIRPGDLTFAHVRAFVDEIVTVPDEAMIRAVRWLYLNARLVVEPSGCGHDGRADARPRQRRSHRGPGRRDRQRRQRRARKYAEYITASSAELT